jgi:hypothetical protein
MLIRVIHYYTIQLFGRVKTCVVLDGEISSSCYLFKDREILVKPDNNTYGTLPIALLVIKDGDKWGNGSVTVHQSTI